MATAFQSNAFQNNAFQIGATAADTHDPGIIKSHYYLTQAQIKKLRAKLKKRFTQIEEIAEETEELYEHDIEELIETVTPLIAAPLTQRAQSNQPPLNFTALLQGEPWQQLMVQLDAALKYKHSLAQEEEELLLVCVIASQI